MSKTSPGKRGSPEISSTRQSSEELGCRQESSLTARNSTLTCVSVDCQHTRRCMEKSSVEQAEYAKTRTQCMRSPTKDGMARTVEDRLTESIGRSRRIVEGPEDIPQLLQKADGRSDAHEEQSENSTDGLSQRRRG